MVRTLDPAAPRPHSFSGKTVPRSAYEASRYANAPSALYEVRRDPECALPARGCATRSLIDPELDLVLKAFDCDWPGFLLPTASADALTLGAFAVPFASQGSETRSTASR